MESSSSSLNSNAWVPPPRPDWVQRVIDEGRAMDIRSIVPLDADSLLNAARQSTGLDDFGADDWREAFHVYVKALDDEANLHLIGRLRARMETLLLLEARLRIEDTYRRHPEIDDEEITKPLIVLGQGRCGSSFLVNCLASNPEDGALLQWECIFPCPPPEKASYRSDPRIERAEPIVTQWNRIQPEIMSMHEYGARLPFEDTLVRSLNFMSASWLGVIGQVPSYDAYVAKLDPKLALRYHKRVLKLLQWKNPRRHWVLKDLYHLTWLPDLLEVYPEACFAWIHRDPVRAIASIVSLMGSMQRVSSDDYLRPGTMDWLKDPGAMLNIVIDQLERGDIAPERICHVHYRDMVRDPMAALKNIYRHHDIPWSDNARTSMQRYLSEHPRDARPPHRFQAPEGEVLASLRQSYRRYQEYFGVPNE